MGKRIISRDHKFTNRINYVERGAKYYYFAGEKHSGKFRAPRTGARDIAFDDQDWEKWENDAQNADYYRSDVTFVQGK